MNIPERLNALRAAMKAAHISAWIIPSSDAHHSEYAADHWQGRRWISGFTGSAGTAVILLDKAGLWADGRYHIQAAKELEDSTIDLFKDGLPETPSFVDWIVSELPEGASVGFDGKVMSHHFGQTLSKKCAKKNLKVVTQHDLLNDVWQDRPELPSVGIQDFPVEYAGKSRADKLKDVRAEMKCLGATHHLIATLDDIVWLYNYRGYDVQCSPVAVAYTIISEGRADLFIDTDKVPSDLAEAFKEDGIHIHEYEDIEKALKEIPSGSSMLYNPDIVNCLFTSLLPQGVEHVEGKTITTLMKACKNPVEIEHTKECHRHDGAAVVKFLKWLDENVPNGTVTELEAEAYLRQCREQNELFYDISFTTIPGYAGNGAMMHYRSTEETSVTLGLDNFFLCDSGGLYTNGTTDITRTMNYGTLTEQQRVDYTLVLKGHISLAMAKFMKGTRGVQLDMLARQPLWQHAINYGCGTGHGVGFNLNVHEGPHSISPKWIDEPLLPGMNVTNEPGIYRQDEYGIRIENLMFVKEFQSSQFGTFYEFEPVTLCPINTKPLKMDMLLSHEIEWLNAYHKEVYKQLESYLDEDEKAWLKQNTQAI